MLRRSNKKKMTINYLFPAFGKIILIGTLFASLFIYSLALRKNYIIEHFYKAVNFLDYMYVYLRVQEGGGCCCTVSYMQMFNSTCRRQKQ
jgi:hypothetical protein